MGVFNHSSHPDAFPRLAPPQAAKVRELGERRTFPDGQPLFEEGERGAGWYLVESGRVRVVQRTEQGDLTVAEHAPGEFTGELALLTRQAALTAAVADGDVVAWHLDPDRLQQLVSDDPELGDLILRTFMRRRDLLEESGYANVTLIGSRWSPRTFELRDFLARNGALFRWVDPDNADEVEQVLRHMRVRPGDLPMIVSHQAGVLRNPPTPSLAEALGLRADLDDEVYDVVIVGAGPAGLGAAVSAASEGLSTLMLEASAPGGQAGYSSRIENFLGFPLGLSGAELTTRAVTQAQRFGARLSGASRAVSLDAERHYKTIALSTGERVTARAVILATGATYRRLDASRCREYEGRGIFYAATPIEADVCREAPVAVVGSGNSAGQAAVYLARASRHVHLVVRGDDLDASMSRYLIDRIAQTPNVQTHLGRTVTAVEGDDRVHAVVLQDRDGREERFEVEAVFVMIGADPCTSWLRGAVALDRQGFVVTGNDARRHADFRAHWHAAREPHFLETTRPGVFAAGDVRTASVKRVASAVGEGSMAVRYVHEVLAG